VFIENRVRPPRSRTVSPPPETAIRNASLPRTRSSMMLQRPAGQVRRRTADEGVSMSISIDTGQGLHQEETDQRPVGPVIEMAQTVIEEQQAELEQLRERLSYYQAFDALINDNIKRSADLFRTIYEERERGRKQVLDARAEIQAAATAEIERQVTEERKRLQATLAGLMNEAGQLQRQVDGWMQRIADAIGETAAPPNEELEPMVEPSTDV
jgi:chromosome segregation ATPase